MGARWRMHGHRKQPGGLAGAEVGRFAKRRT